jgi:hypothetical protein
MNIVEREENGKERRKNLVKRLVQLLLEENLTDM